MNPNRNAFALVSGAFGVVGREFAGGFDLAELAASAVRVLVVSFASGHDRQTSEIIRTALGDAKRRSVGKNLLRDVTSECI
jgi:hypothetical protein